ncbi:MAG: galactoside ABC transporter permease [Treponema sp.]|nr:galactoside ABC transporter permease [Treponema sp.]
MAQDIESVNSLEESVKLNEYSKTLEELRKDGVNKISLLNQKIAEVKRSKMMNAQEKEKTIAECKAQLQEAKSVAAKNNAKDKAITKEAVAYANALSKNIVAKVTAEQNAVKENIKREYLATVEQIQLEAAERESKILSERSENTKAELATARYELKSALFDAKNKYKDALQDCKDAIHQAFVDHVQKNISLRNSRTNFVEEFQQGIRNYAYQFTPQEFLLKNGLYVAILIFFIACIIIAPLAGKGVLLNLPNIFTILEQSSVRMFYALGVAGLILLAGTDLSVGRMVALGSVITGLLLHPGENIVKLFGLGPWNFTAMSVGSRIATAIILSILFCVMFSAIAGFFSAYFKMHPFISTLATQLIIYGLLFFGTSGTPVGSIDKAIKDAIGGRWELGYVGGDFITFPKLIVPAVIAVFVAWFIWNKTTFGKNMFAVGGNPEAASVSGISVFWVTLGVFVMAGVFYGCGAFLEAFRANASAGTGQGYEMDAIAACVVGGVSFYGGIGKISGAVLGVIIFTGLTYCLTFLGIDTNLQFVFKGLIILAAVSLDCVKYLKKK